MADIFREVEDDLRRDRIGTMWKRYGILAAVAALVVVGGTVATVWYRNHLEQRAQERTATLTAALDIAGEAQDGARAKAADALDSFARQIAPSGQATLARFQEAALRAQDGNEAAAITLYEGVAADPAADPALRDAAALFAVMRQIDKGDITALQARLAPLAADTSPWRFSARELSAALDLRAGDPDKARQLFAALADDAAAPADLRGRAAELAAAIAEPK